MSSLTVLSYTLHSDIILQQNLFACMSSKRVMPASPLALVSS